MACVIPAVRLVAVCNCAVHKKCHDKILGRCTGSATDSRETKVTVTAMLQYIITKQCVFDVAFFSRIKASSDMFSVL